MANNESYTILGLKRDASQPEIHRAYRRLAKRFHPDMNAGQKTAEEIFKRIGAAYADLTAAPPPPDSYTPHPAWPEPKSDYAYEEAIERRYQKLRGGAKFKIRQGRIADGLLRRAWLFSLELMVGALKIFDQLVTECWTLIKWLSPLG